MKYLLIAGMTLTMGFYSAFFALMVVGSSFIDKLPETGSMSFTSDIEQPSEGQTKVLPDLQLQPASSIQGTVGVE